MIDIHSHFLPGLDDGARSWDEFLEMSRVAVTEGISHIVVTPHMMPDGQFANRKHHVEPKIEEARERLTDARIDLQLVIGGEIYLSPTTPEDIERGDVLTYGDDKKYALVELPAREVPLFAEDVFFELQLQGVTPILAHPERYFSLARSMDVLIDWIDRGVLLQVNARSLLGESGSQVQQLAEDLLKRRMVHFLASDAHGMRRRPPGLLKAYERIRTIVGDDMANALVRDNPRRVLQGDAIVPSEIQEPQRRSLFRRLFRR